MLELEFKKISEDTMNVMENSVSSNHDFYGDAVKSVESLLGDGDIHCSGQNLKKTTKPAPETVKLLDRFFCSLHLK